MERLSNIPVEVPIHHVSSFDHDDPFCDDDDNPQIYRFTPDKIREDLARQHPIADTASWLENRNTLVENDSVSTLDMNAPPMLSEHVSPAMQTPNDDPQLSSHFSQISLSESEHSAPSTPNEDETHHTDATSNSESPYPNVIIDASQPSSHQTIVTPDEVVSTALAQDSDQSPSLELPLDKDGQSEVLRTSSSGSTPTVQTAPMSISPVTPPSISTKKNSVQRSSRSNGPSALEKVRSRTRPSFLPPKSREEDDKHLADWQHMMKHSRISAEKRRKALQERRSQREKAIEETLHIWEKEILPDWKVVHKNAELRKLWWKGIPTKLRPVLWERAVGNALALSKDHYRTCLSRAKRALASGVFPQNSLEMIEQDISTTTPSLHIFHPETGPLYSELKDMLYAWVVSRSDEGLGYCMGAAKVAAMILINMPNQQGFIVMRNLLERHCLRSFFGGEKAKDDVEAYYRIFDTLLADGMPKIYFNFKQHQLSPSSYLPDWIIPLFLAHLPFEACARLWDVIILEGDSFVYRAALGILAVLEPRLFFPDKKELLELLSGKNKAALEVARREGCSLNGGIYEIYGVDEETLWERIDSMHDWWRDSTWIRLTQRELPDL